MTSFLFPFLVSWLCCFLLVRYQHIHQKFSADSDLLGVQKVHSHQVPRIGGLAIALGIWLSLIVAIILERLPKEQVNTTLFLLLSSLPIFIIGLIEDISKKISPKIRLIASFISAILACYLIDGVIPKTSIYGIDELMVLFPVFAWFLSAIAVAGLTNAVNIIDGFNGLASMVVMMMLFSVGYVGFQLHDQLIWIGCLLTIGAVAGFFLWNFPNGHLFLGDGGAYLLGFLLAEWVILLVARHQNSLSPWYGALLLIYPIFEVIFSIYRRKFITNLPPTMPDGVHLHMLIYRRLVRWTFHSHDQRRKKHRNASTSVYLWVLSGLSIVPATLFYQRPRVLLAFTILFIVSYIILYAKIVRFQSPKWLIWHKNRKS